MVDQETWGTMSKLSDEAGTVANSSAAGADGTVDVGIIFGNQQKVPVITSANGFVIVVGCP